MSKNKPRQAAVRTTAQPAKPQPTPAAQVKQENGFIIKYPLLWLAAAILIVYSASFNFGFTELDDVIFIRDFSRYNEDLSNLFDAFKHGLFNPVSDPYYRPLFMDSMILNYHLADHGQNLVSYHVINVLLHILSVGLLYKLFTRLNMKSLHAFILCLLFAVHPVLSQAVAWIPGRNDTMLAAFIFSFLLFCLDYTATGKMRSLLLSALFLLLAFFTKETAVFAAPVAFVLLVVMMQKPVFDKRNLVQYGVWAGSFLVWFAVRAGATIQTNISAGQVVKDFAPRLPVIIQYLGKIFLPFNLSVFPTQEDTVIYFGLGAVALLALIILLAKDKNVRIILSGLAIFLLFLLPALLVPNKLNEQAFEHRLYLPMVGILLVLSQTVIFRNNLKEKTLFFICIGVIAALSVVNFQHQKNFTDPVTFWTSAMKTSPRSAYATMMLAARLPKEDFQESCSLFRKAYALNPNEKYLNFYIGEMLQNKDSVQASEPYLLAEKKNTGYFKCDFYLARVAMDRKDLPGAIKYMEEFVKKAPQDGPGNNNLLHLYLDTRQSDKAKAQAIKMKNMGMPVPKEILQQLGI